MWLALLLSTLGYAQDPPPAEPPAEGEELPILEMPAVVEYVEAPYPEEARAQGLEGTVVVLVEIDETGAVLAAEVTGPAGHGFDEAALAAVKAMRFSPARTAEGPVAVAFEFAYGFVLKAEPPPEPSPDQPLAPAPVNVDGTIREMGTRKDVEGARVVVVGLPDGAEITSGTDATGRFELRGVPTGTWTLRVLHPGHVTLEQIITVAEGEALTATLWIRAEQYRENEAVGAYRREEQEITRRTLTIDEVRKVPGTFGDPVKVVQTLPGAARSPFGTGLLIIRGSNPEDSGVYVDGVRIPIIYHLTGTTSVLSPDLIEAVDYLPGGYGVQYGRSMGGVVDIRTKRKFDETKLIWGTDILDSQVYFQGNVGPKDEEGKRKHGVAVGARRSYIDVFLPWFLSGGYVVKPRYWDYQAKWTPDLGDGRELSLFVYGFDDLITVSTPDDVAQGPDQDTQGDLVTEYLSHRVVAQYKQDLGADFQLRLTPSLGYDYALFGLGDEFTLDSTNTLLELRSEVSWKPSDHVEIVPGIDLIGGWFGFNFASPFRWVDIQDPLAEREPISIEGSGDAWGPDLYLKANLRPLSDPERLLVMPGIRSSFVHMRTKGSIVGDEGGEPLTIQAWDPRLLTRYKLTETLTLKGGSGLYQQPPQPFEMIGIGTEAVVDFERAWANDLGVEHQLSPAISWDVSLFYKDLTDLVLFSENWGGFGDQGFYNGGRGRAYGTEIIVRHAPVGRFFGWVSYTMSRSERCDRDCEDRGNWYWFDFDQPHIFSAQAGYDLPRDFGVSAQVQYVSGNPDTPYNAGVYDADGDFYNGFRIGEYNDERLPPFFQTSVRFDRLWTFKAWQLETYVDLMNAVKGVNPEATIYAYDYTERAYVRGLPFIPNIGIEARFYP